MRVKATVALFLMLGAGHVMAQPKPGRLVIIGGGLSRDNEAVYRAILDGRLNGGPVCVIPTAAATPDSAMASPIAAFERYGGKGSAAGVLVSALSPETAGSEVVVQQIAGCGGFYFLGGVQSRVVAAFRPNGVNTPAYDAIMRRYREGAVVSGSSAGAAIMTDPMIAGGTSAGALANGVRRAALGGAAGEDEAGGVSITAGLGFLNSAITDQHFLARGRIGRLIVAVADAIIPNLGFGVDENTALILDGDIATVAGESGVVVVDGTNARSDARTINDVSLHLMSAGDSLDLRSVTLTIDPQKSAVPRIAGAVVASTNGFARWEFLKVIQAFAASADTSATVPVAGGKLRLRRSSGFAAAHRDTSGVQGTLRGLSIRGMRVDLLR